MSQVPGRPPEASGWAAAPVVASGARLPVLTAAGPAGRRNRYHRP